MLNSHALRKAAHGVSDRLLPIETSLDQTLSQTANLLAYLPQARLDANLPMATGHGAIMRVMASLSSIIVARSELLAAHEEFVVARDELRIPITDTGSLGGCPRYVSLAQVA